MPGPPQEQELIFLHRGVERAALLPPTGDQAIEADRIDHRPRQDVRADLGALFHHHHRDVAARLRRQLLYADGGRQPSRPGADDDDIEIHALAGRQLHFILCHLGVVPCTRSIHIRPIA